MLISFSVKNHKGCSDINTDTLMISSKSKDLITIDVPIQKVSLLKSVFIVGMNGVGKTSYLDALWFMTKAANGEWYVGDRETYDYALPGQVLDKDKVSTYKIRITKDKFYSLEYGFSISGGFDVTIEREWLTLLTPKGEVPIFDRVRKDTPEIQIIVSGRGRYNKKTKMWEIFTPAYTYHVSPKMCMSIVNTLIEETSPRILSLTRVCHNIKEAKIKVPPYSCIKAVGDFFENKILFLQNVRECCIWRRITEKPYTVETAKELLSALYVKCADYYFDLTVKHEGSKIPPAVEKLIDLCLLMTYAGEHDILLVADDLCDGLDDIVVEKYLDLFHKTLSTDSQLLASSRNLSLISDCVLDYQMYLLTEKGNSYKVSESLGEALELLAGD